MKTSDRLKVGELYTREALKANFGIVDQTIKNGIFRPKGHDSIWLFITKEKRRDRTQYTDKLEGANLHMDGQIAGRTDQLLIDHAARGLEVLLFYRERIKEHPSFGFRYEGLFRYVAHTGKHPAQFHFCRV